MDDIEKSIISLAERVLKVPLTSEEMNSVQMRVIKILSGEFDFTDSFKKLREDIYRLPRFVVHSPMFCRDTVGLHHERLTLLGPCTQYIISYCENKLGTKERESFDFTYFSELLARHDEVEIFSPFGDIPTHIKYSLPDECRELLEQVEISVEAYISHNFQSTEYYDKPEEMMRLFRDSREKKRLESQLMSYLDKIDGYMMALHEVTAGNEAFLEPLKNYISILERIFEGNQLPLLSPFFKVSFGEYKAYLGNFHEEDEDSNSLHQWFLQFWHLFNIQSLFLNGGQIKELFKKGTLHSENDFKKENFGVPGYLSWKRGVTRGGILLKKHLTTQVEI